MERYRRPEGLVLVSLVVLRRRRFHLYPVQYMDYLNFHCRQLEMDAHMARNAALCMYQNFHMTAHIVPIPHSS